MNDSVAASLATFFIQEGEVMAAAGDHVASTHRFNQALAYEPSPNTPVYVWVKPGRFTMGSTPDDENANLSEEPQHELYLEGYWIQSTEVTNAQYQNCMRAEVCTAPSNTVFSKPEFANHPVTAVNWTQAQRYAEWVGGRLPSEAEWEKACRGPDGQIRPWGTENPNADLLNYANLHGGTVAVGSYPAGASPYGVLDMLGNVWEWTRSVNDTYPYAAFDGREAPESLIIRGKRGGAFAVGNDRSRCALRNFSEVNYADIFTGFRVISPGPSQGRFEEGGKLAWNGDIEGAVAAFVEVLEMSPESTLDPVTQAHDLGARGQLAEGRRLAEKGQLADAKVRLERANELDPTLDIDPAAEIGRIVTAGYIEEGRQSARQGDLDGAIEQFNLALELDPTVIDDPALEARVVAAEAYVKKGEALAKGGFVVAARESYTEAMTLDPSLELSGQNWNILCWYGSIYGYAADVFDACQNAVDADQENGNFHDSRGLARALTGDVAGAIEDFTFYVEWSKLPKNNMYDPHGIRREAWIAALESGQNPFDARTLESLR